eukprot:GFUD01021811.1.p1 GENE.GFUD01021811.1~~GFUD01021811.1.p1  ORF type:complete len:131 (-),score=55.10 GFUD01021811.1:143-535(-)
MEKTSLSSGSVTTSTCSRGKKGRRPKYTVLDLSVGVDKNGGLDKGGGGEGQNDIDESQVDTKNGADYEENKVDAEDLLDEDEDGDLEEDSEERRTEKREKDQEYNLFVKSHQKRSHCTTKKSRRERNYSE